MLTADFPNPFPITEVSCRNHPSLLDMLGRWDSLSIFLTQCQERERDVGKRAVAWNQKAASTVVGATSDRQFPCQFVLSVCTTESNNKTKQTEILPCPNVCGMKSISPRINSCL